VTQSTLTHSGSAPKTGETVWLWLIKLVTGPLLVVLLGIHLIVNHFVANGGLMTYADVVAYYQNPIVPVMEIAFLAVVVTHSLIGLRGILLDLKPSRRLLRLIDWVLLVVGIVSVSYGVWLVLAIVSKGV
jgi:succinate dehydrogenase hydrophobic anchor subunit